MGHSDNMKNLHNVLLTQWYQPQKWGWSLWPLAKLFNLLVRFRHYCYKNKFFTSHKVSVPVVVVGNITVGGAGKTPLVIFLAQLLQQQGLRPGILLRGYKNTAKTSLFVYANADPKVVGDEAVLLAKRCSCPVVVSKDRVAGANKLIRDHKVEVILCDDGLQHYALQRDIEIAVIDGARGFGNGYSLPMGPLRELPNRLESVDFTVTNGADMLLEIGEVYSLLNPRRKISLENFVGKTVHAVAGIGHPERFFRQLRDLGIKVIPHAFPDHHVFKMADISFSHRLPVLMTEKDAVKCTNFANDEHWVVAISAVLANNFTEEFCKKMQGVINAR